jgi:hypothetical protein
LYTFITSRRCSAITDNFSIKVFNRSSVACDIIAATSGGGSSNPCFKAKFYRKKQIHNELVSFSLSKQN